MITSTQAKLDRAYRRSVPRPFFSVKRVGVMTFVRVGKLNLSFCFSK